MGFTERGTGPANFVTLGGVLRAGKKVYSSAEHIAGWMGFRPGEEGNERVLNRTRVEAVD